ncbi:MAG: hypothetical protein HLUCCO18_01865 [Rhodobacteraceae bacterium HLUCCO18]|nr:MAG: hypothetical protein HLUCCO18_01865 [Rhodobacteraceae bacterium HLUCCO18]
MQSRAEAPRGATRVMALTLIAALALVFLRSALVAPDVAERMTTSDNDSIMRLLSVRDWLNGQGWFDMSNDRVLPPEGLSLHWSRYVDLGIAGVIGGLSLFMSHDKAEALSLIMWPGLLMVCFLALTMVMTRRLFGPQAAAVAIIGVVLWRLTGSNYFGPMQIDHHGLQILLLAIVVFTLVIDGDALRRGITGGAAAALSLAVGLENLLPIAMAGVVLALLAVIAADRPARLQLQAFGLSLFAIALPLHLGQTSPGEWTLARCDELGPPILGLVGLAALAAMAIGIVAARVPGPGVRIGASAGVAIIAAAGAVWIMQACPNFPYSNLPDPIREMIGVWIVEARPAQTFIFTANRVAFSHILPAFATTFAATAVALWRWRTGAAGVNETRAAAILLVFAWIGTLGSFAQVRMAVLAAPVIPVLMGYTVASLLDMRRHMARQPIGSLLVVSFVACAVVPGQLHLAYAIISSAHASSTADRQRDSCRRGDIITSLDSLPEGRILAPTGLAPPILHGTHHTMVSVPYHRSAEALGNAILPFVNEDADALLAAVDRSRPDYVVMCADGNYGNGAAFVNGFARGETLEGLRPVDGFGPEIIVLEVVR